MLSYLIFGALVVVVILTLLKGCIKVVGQYESGVILTFGKATGRATPGLNLLIPGVQTLMSADTRVSAWDIPAQDVITSDNVSVKVSAVAYFQVEDAEKALLGVQDFGAAIGRLAQITLRSTIGAHALDDLLSNQEKLNQTLGQAIEARSGEWGIRVDHVEIRSVDLDASMVRAMAQEAEAERGRRARVITAQGEFEAAQKLAAAADILGKSPAAITLRTLATLKEIGAEKNSVIIYPVSQEAMMGPQIASAAIAKAVADHSAGAEAATPQAEAAQA
ncbi:SPFH domain-containing protein [Paraburkholderia sp. EG287A]|uniref:SPFH domain-containing protein n=1 Tax=Paraburkholderia sp. EG287A TaxID=3237012 RepID=UPI0034D16211